MKKRTYELPAPDFFKPNIVKEVKKIEYEDLHEAALTWRENYKLSPAAADHFRICLMPIDTQLTFCHPDFELFVGGRSGTGAIDDNVRLCEFIYRNLAVITEIDPTMDTHTAMQIFFRVFWIDQAGNHPPASTIITYDEIKAGDYRVNPAMAKAIAGGNYPALQNYAEHYVKCLTDEGKYPLMIWPYHAMLGGIGHALVPALEEAAFFHNIARASQTGFEIKGGNPLTENYSVLRPEILVDQNNQAIANKNARFINKLLNYDAIVIAGQAKSHCVAWTIADLLDEIVVRDERLAKKVYLLEDCTSPVVIPGIFDFTDQANEAFERFANAGMNVVKTTIPIADWPGVKL